MSRRIDIELTSRRDDGWWTWRAPGAREPRGAVDGSLVPPGTSVGDVLRADADFEIDGIVVTAVQPQKQERDEGRGTRLEVLGSGRGFSSGVSVTTAPGKRRRRDEERGPKPERRPRAGAPQRRPGRVAPGEGDETSGARRPRARDTSDGTRRGRRPERAERPERAGRPARGEAAERRDRSESTPRPERGAVRGPRAREAPKERRERRRLEPMATHRNEALAQLPPERLPVAEQLLRGGIPAVRRAIEEQNARARAEGRAEISPEPLLAMAEELLPIVSLAAWKDRAVTVRNAGRDAPLREVRSVVSAATAVTLDEEARTLVASLRESLDARVTALREAWLGRITKALDHGRVADALRISAHAPEPGARLPAEVAVRLASAAGAAMVPELSHDQWHELLDAVVESPVRRSVKPAGLPHDAGDDLLLAARRAAGFVPELARLLGLPIPPPPGRRRVAATAGRRG